MNIRNSVIASLLAVVTIAGSAAVAQLSPSDQETLRTTVGSVFEIQAVGGQGKVSWVLTQNGEFVEANRDDVFRTRFSRPGSFVLSAETSKDGQTVQRKFLLNVQDRKPGDKVPTANQNSVASFTPPIVNGTIRLSQKTHVITVTPERKDIKVIAIDTDIGTDSNNDGNPQNDDNTKNSLFRSEGSPLNLWIVNGEPRGMRIGALFSDNDTKFESITISRGGSTPMPDNAYPDENTIDEAPDGMKIQVLKSDNGEVQFGLQMDSDEKSSVLLLWNFGDGQQSMLDKPIHVFAESGKYDISVEIRDLKTGTVKSSVSDSIVINRMKDDTNPTPDVPVTTKPNKDKGEDSGSILGLIFKLILTLIVSGAIGAGILFLVGKMKKKGFSLEKSLEKAEEAIVKTPKETVAETAPPMEIVSEPEVVTPPPAQVIEPTQVPEVEAAPVPEWLEPKPVAEPQPEVVSPTPASSPVTETVTPEPIAEEPAPNVTHTAMEPAAEKLETDPAKAPDWLQDGIEKAEEEGQTVDAPPPEELQGDAPKEVPLTTTDSDKEREERLREKKRQKRQRYRENVKNRKENTQVTPETPTSTPVETPSPATESEDMNEPVAFIKAEDIAPLEGNTPNPATEEHSENDEKQGS